MNIAVCGSQVVGLVPQKAILNAADYYCEKENLFILEEDQRIRLVRMTMIKQILKNGNSKKRMTMIKILLQ